MNLFFLKFLFGSDTFKVFDNMLTRFNILHEEEKKAMLKNVDFSMNECV